MMEPEWLGRRIDPNHRSAESSTQCLGESTGGRSNGGSDGAEEWRAEEGRASLERIRQASDVGCKDEGWADRAGLAGLRSGRIADVAWKAESKNTCALRMDKKGEEETRIQLLFFILGGRGRLQGMSGYIRSAMKMRFGLIDDNRRCNVCGGEAGMDD